MAEETESSKKKNRELDFRDYWGVTESLPLDPETLKLLAFPLIKIDGETYRITSTFDKEDIICAVELYNGDIINPDEDDEILRDIEKKNIIRKILRNGGRIKVEEFRKL